MATITLSFNFSRESSDGASHSDNVHFEAESGLVDNANDKADELLDALNSDLEDGEDEWVFDEFEIDDYDDDFADPYSFSDLDDYAEYIEKCEKHGEAYVLRYEDIGDFDFDDQYSGSWDCVEDWGQETLDSLHKVPDYLENYIDIERWTSDALMDYSTYEGSDGVHIFRN